MATLDDFRTWDPDPAPKPVKPEFVDSYLETALWSSLDDEGRPMDDRYGTDDFAQEAINEAVRVANDFINDNRELLEKAGDASENWSKHGHDFWLTRNHHGTGFWDRGYGDVGKKLTKAAHAYGESNVYVGDDGLLYLS